MTERWLAAELGVSRTPLREVLKLLEHEKLLERNDRGQLVISTLSVEDIRQIHDCQMRIETLAARDAATLATQADVEGLDLCVNSAWEAFQEGRDDDLVDYNAEFHLRVFEAARNPWLTLVSGPLRNQMFRIRVQLTEVHHSATWRDEHFAIVSAISAGDPSGAEEAMALHIRSDTALHLAAAEAKEGLSA